MKKTKRWLLIPVLLVGLLVPTFLFGNGEIISEDLLKQNALALLKSGMACTCNAECPGDVCHNGKCLCIAGGPNATSCSIDAGADVLGYGVSVGCSVSCGGGSYACCALRCSCSN